MGVSIGISNVSGPHATSPATPSAASRPPDSLTARLLFLGASAVIDFLEQVEILPDFVVVRIQLGRLLVRLARLVELPFVLVGNGQIVEGRRVGRIELDGLFPAVGRFAPEPAL